MSPGVIGEASIARATAAAVHPIGGRGAVRDGPVRPVAPSARAPGDAFRRASANVIDLRPNPPEDAEPRPSVRPADADPRPRAEPLRLPTGEPPAAVPGQANDMIRRANPDTPFRRRNSDQSYAATETLDAPVPHRGAIFDLTI